MKPEQDFINRIPEFFLRNRDEQIVFGFLPLNYIFPQSDDLTGRHDSYFENNTDENWQQFKKDVHENGMFWPFFVTPFDYEFPHYKITSRNEYVTEDVFGDTIPRSKKFILREGNHRLKAYLQLANDGLIPKDFLVPTVICMDGYPLFPGDYFGDRQLIESFPIYGKYYDNYHDFWQRYFREVQRVSPVCNVDKTIKPCRELNEPGLFLPNIDLDKYVHM